MIFSSAINHSGEFLGLKIIDPKLFRDERGYFYESYKHSVFSANGISHDFPQDNQSFSVRGVVRGLHFQTSPKAQAKLVRCVKGEVYDVAVDLRKSSKTFGKFFGINLSEKNKLMFFIPEGFAHGFSALSSEAELLYKTSAEYDPSCEFGIRWNDEDLAIDWGVENPIVSAKDQVLPAFKDLKHFF